MSGWVSGFDAEKRKEEIQAGSWKSQEHGRSGRRPMGEAMGFEGSGSGAPQAT